MVAVGVNKSAEQYMLLDEDTKADLARGKYHDQRRGTFGQPEPGTARPAAPAPAQGAPVPRMPAQGSPPQGAPSRGTPPRGAPSRDTPAAGRQPPLPGTASQRRLAVLYNQQGLRPDEIASKLGLSRYDVTQIILASPRRGRA